LRHTKYIDLRIVGWKEFHDAAPVAFPTSAWPRLRSAASASVVQGDRVDKRRGRLTIYVGAAPGVGKTYKMLRDAHDWRRRGIDVVVGLVETHGREETAAQILNLEVLAKRSYRYEQRTYEELDVEGVIARAPEAVIIDELPHTNTPGSKRESGIKTSSIFLNTASTSLPRSTFNTLKVCTTKWNTSQV